MSIVSADLKFAAKLSIIPDEAFLQAWHAAITAGAEQQIAMVERAATLRFGMADWRHAYVARFPAQTYYQLPAIR